MAKKKISIGIICFNEETNVAPCYNALAKIASTEKKYDFEFVFSDNKSTDKTRDEIKKIAKKDSRVTGVFLSRNFGPESNSQAALDYATGDAFILYEGDMQDPPKFIPKLIRKWEKGFDIVAGIRTKIEDTPAMTVIRKLYYKILKKISDIDIPIDSGSFGIIDKKVMNAIRDMPEKYRFYRGLRAWVGFNTAYITYYRTKRKRGKTSYNVFRYIRHAERSVFGFSYLPLDIVAYSGFLITFVSIVSFITYLTVNSLTAKSIDKLTFLSFILFIVGGIQLLALGIIGKYVQVIMEETKKRPVYIVKDIVVKSKAKKRFLPMHNH